MYRTLNVKCCKNARLHGLSSLIYGKLLRKPVTFVPHMTLLLAPKHSSNFTCASLEQHRPRTVITIGRAANFQQLKERSLNLSRPFTALDHHNPTPAVPRWHNRLHPSLLPLELHFPRHLYFPFRNSFPENEHTSDQILAFLGSRISLWEVRVMLVNHL